MAADVEQQSSTLPPAQPRYIFRGHAAQIHSIRIVHRNTHLVTGDADGWVVLWRLESKRPLAVWRAHDAAVLGTAAWGSEKLITHGRDNALRIWQLRPQDTTAGLSTVLPADGDGVHRPKPWLLHALPVNTLNFCAFSMCCEQHAGGSSTSNNKLQTVVGQAYSTSSSDSVLVAVPARDDKQIEVYRFANEKLAYTVPRVQPVDTGMVMAVKLAYNPSSNTALLIAGYEGGFTAVHLLPRTRTSGLQLAQTIYLSQPHTQPILSVDASPEAKTYFTSSADAIIASHRIPDIPLNFEDENEDSTASADAGLVATSVENVEQDANTLLNSPLLGGDAERPAPMKSSPQTEGLGAPRDAPLRSEDANRPVQELLSDTMQVNSESESLKFSRKPIGSPLSFSKQPLQASRSPETTNQPKPSGLSSLLSSTTPLSRPRPKPSPPAPLAIQPPYRTVNTKHSGQQSLRVRSDGRLLVTGGWDSRVRIYSAKTLKEVAVLKWHQEGVYAVDFSEILVEADLINSSQELRVGGEVEKQEIRKRETGLGRLQRQREEQLQLKHWVAAGAKDGKISLWEVF